MTPSRLTLCLQCDPTSTRRRMIAMTVTRYALRSDLGAMADALVDAFTDDPWFNWLYPSPSDWPSQPRAWFGLVLERAFAGGHTFLAKSGVANWIPPDVTFPSDADLDLAVELLRGQMGERVSTALGVIGQIGPYFPHVPRFHCVYIGVAQGSQGRGIGGALMSRVLEVCDREALPASLTSSNDKNLPWYRSLGFKEIAAVEVPGADFKMRPMWREPAST